MQDKSENAPLISIIIVCYNSYSTIRETFDSIICQVFKNYELIVIDGGSTDGTLNILKEYQEYFRYSISEKDDGIYDAMNKGIVKARGKYIYFIGSDDVIYNSNSLNEVSNHLKDSSTIYYGDVLFKTRNVIYDGAFNIFKIATRNISHQSIFYPITAFHNQKFEVKYKIYADYAFNLKLYGSGAFGFKYIPVIIANFNDLGASGSLTQDECFQKDFLSIIKKNFPFYIYIYRIVRTKISKLLGK
ncbi:glycosyltransferase family 2 protein [Pedobacter alluvionis]|uniref:Glycosyltransferase n=1 Tax=Pedobacter alluvionis TaxID=475253 RepID=A0A497XVX1_9SPHI|nr:glycosyltransferase family 2 protein [Pedobacter alluvionis]RLJ73895.1 glycosyltransferase involved in cell wall biosynthesis [Pedobacter alluvionis]TFB32498.1 glycosyltransferase [Pedobacter alluvionis]